VSDSGCHLAQRLATGEISAPYPNCWHYKWISEEARNGLVREKKIGRSSDAGWSRSFSLICLLQETNQPVEKCPAEFMRKDELKKFSISS